MNLLTRSVLEDLIKIDNSLSEIDEKEKRPLSIHHHITPHPAMIIAKIMGLTDDEYDDFICELMDDVYRKKVTVTEAIDQLEKTRQLIAID